MRVYVHGAGRKGREAWPSASEDYARFATLDFAGAMSHNVASLVGIVPRDAVVFAHSAGAVPVFLALQENAIEVRALILLEPGLYDIARGDSAIETHIASMTRARALSGAGDMFGYWSIVRPSMFGVPAERDHWESEREAAARFEAKQPPWGFGVRASAIVGVPTLVITGGWNAEYEAIAGVLEQQGTARTQLRGNGHRPQDHPGFNAVVEEFIDGVPARA